MRRATGKAWSPSERCARKGWNTLAPSLVVATALSPSCVPEGPPTSEQPSDASASGAPQPSPDRSADGTTDPVLSGAFVDDFERDALGENWRALSPAWRIRDGELCVRGARNRGVWLKRRVPAKARVELDARADSPEGDIKLELWGDGARGATKASYDDASGYIAIFGGWSNQRHVLARLDEHGADRRVTEVSGDDRASDPSSAAVVPGRTYHLRIERRDAATIRWWVDDVLMHAFADPEPLSGPGHDHVGLNDWMAPVCFDNLEVTPL